jgi:hypothetical protein
MSFPKAKQTKNPSKLDFPLSHFDESRSSLADKFSLSV